MSRKPGAIQSARIASIEEIQYLMHEVLCDAITQEAQNYAEDALYALLEKQKADTSLLYFFNGWNETHKTTSLVSGKIIMRLATDAVYIPQAQQGEYHRVLAHMHEVTKDDFGLGQKGHDGMYKYMTAAFGASAWGDEQYKVNVCDDFSTFLYATGVAQHKAAMNSTEHKKSIVDAMMVSISSELWNGREYNFLAQFIEEKVLSLNPSLSNDPKNLRNAKAYVLGHSGEVENRHGLHALAAAQAFCFIAEVAFDIERLKGIMLEYNKKVGKSFSALHDILLSE